MEIAKLYEDEIFQIEQHMYNTEKAICYALDQLGLKLGKDFEFFVEIDNIPFTKSKKHKVDLMLTSRINGSKRGEELSELSIRRLQEYIEYRNNDLKKWRGLR